MKLPYPSRLVVACIALISMLFMQLAVASYTCPGMAMESNGMSTYMSDQIEPMAMTGCDGMDMEQPSLCQTHAFGDATKQSLDKHESPQVQPFVPAGFVQALPVVEAVKGADTDTRPSALLTRITAPPIAIQHCCFRI